MLKEGDKVYYRDMFGDRHVVRIAYLFRSAQGNDCAYLMDGATKLVTELTKA